jgi:hypothetical protein
MGEPCTGGGRGIGQLGRVWSVKGGGTQLGSHRGRTNEGGITQLGSYRGRTNVKVFILEYLG